MTPSTAQIGRFTVRDVNLWDAPDLLALFGDAETVKYMGVPQLQNAMEANLLISRYQSGPGRWLAVHGGPEFLGVVGLEIRAHQATVTLAFNRSRRARGAGREFSVPFVRWLFTQSQIWRVWAYCHVDNVPVQRVLERMGAEREGRLRRFEVFPNLSTEPQDAYVYAIVRR